MKKDSLKGYEILYLLALCIYVGAFLFEGTYLFNILKDSGETVELVMKILRYFAYYLCFVRIIGMMKVKYNWVFAAILSAVCIAPIIVFGADKAPLFYLLFFFGAKDVKFERILKVFFCLQAATLIFCLICALLFNIGAESIPDAGRIRSFLGFGWVNRASYIWLGIVFEYVCLKKGKLNIPEVLIAVLVAGVIYKKTATRYSFVMTVGVIVIIVLREIYVKLKSEGVLPVIVKEKKFYKGMKWLFILCALFGTFFCKLYSPNIGIMVKLNRVLNSRLSLGKNGINTYGYSLFGSKTEWIGASTQMWEFGSSQEYNYVDFGYLQLALDYGILMLILAVILYEMGLFVAERKKDITIAYCISLLGILCIFEPRLVDFTVNPFILYGIAGMSCLMKSGNTESDDSKS